MFRFYFLLFITAILISCSGSKDVPVSNDVPTNLILNAVVTSDSSGNVNFASSATNAISFEYDFGNGVFQTVQTGIITYKYPLSGNYTIKVTAKSTSGLAISKTIDITVAVKLTLIWSDDFDVAGSPDPSKWGYDIGEGGWGNAELQNYTARTDNATVSNGTLKIIAKKENYGTSAYTSARLLSKGKFSVQYGKIEIRAKLPSKVGTWPAIWMLGNNISTANWPACGEIDIMEHRAFELNKIFGTVHYQGQSNPAVGEGSTVIISNAAIDFHRYAIQWSATSIKFMVDDVVFYTFSNTSNTPFNQSFFMILNLAMGGNFGGTVAPTFVSDQMEIDYVHIYQ